MVCYRAVAGVASLVLFSTKAIAYDHVNSVSAEHRYGPASHPPWSWASYPPRPSTINNVTACHIGSPGCYTASSVVTLSTVVSAPLHATSPPPISSSAYSTPSITTTRSSVTTTLYNGPTCASAIPTQSNGAPFVVLPSGTLVGQRVVPTTGSSVDKFLGVPFAQSPPERFSPASAPDPYGTWDASYLRPACIQEFPYPLIAANFERAVFNNPGGPTPLESEDCLYANVYVPAKAPPPSGYPVMFWIYGGSFRNGYAGDVMYDGTSFASHQDVIVVTIAYRTNVFGFVPSPAVPKTEQNLGLLDQHFALEWCHDNIAAFGGDPSRVTIFGESAGAVSVDLILTALPDSDWYHAAIMESGQATFGGATLHDDSTYAKSWTSLVSALNCSTGDNAAELACVRRADALVIQNLMNVNSLVFGSTIDNVTVVPAPRAQKLAGNSSRVPVLMGTNAQEGRLFDYGQSNLTAFLDNLLPNNELGIPDAIHKAYDGAYPDAFSEISQITTDLEFGCTCAAAAQLSYSQGIPTWRYYYNATFPNIQPFPDLGVYHTSEIPIVFGSISPITAQEYALSDYMQTAWAKFAKDPYTGPGWPRYNTSLGVLGANGTSGVTVVDPTTVDFRCSIYQIAYDYTSP